MCAAARRDLDLPLRAAQHAAGDRRAINAAVGEVLNDPDLSASILTCAPKASTGPFASVVALAVVILWPTQCMGRLLLLEPSVCDNVKFWLAG